MKKKGYKFKRLQNQCHAADCAKVDFSDLKKTFKGLEKVQAERVLMDKIQEYLKIKGIGQAIVDGVEFIMRLRLGQFSIAFEQVQKYFAELNKENFNYVKNDLHKIIDYIGEHGISKKWRGDMELHNLLWNAEGKCNGRPIARSIDIEEPLYEAEEFGEFLRCLEMYGGCEYAKECWVTRRGFCKRRNKK